MYSMTGEKDKILVVCSFCDKEIKHPIPAGFDMDSARLILCNYAEPKRSTLRPYECKVYRWK